MLKTINSTHAIAINSTASATGSYSSQCRLSESTTVHPVFNLHFSDLENRWAIPPPCVKLITEGRFAKPTWIRCWAHLVSAAPSSGHFSVVFWPPYRSALGVRQEEAAHGERAMTSSILNEALLFSFIFALMTGIMLAAASLLYG